MNSHEQKNKSRTASHRSFTELISEIDTTGIQNARSVWEAGMYSEIDFWDSYFKTKGLEWADSYEMRFDPDLPLQERPAELLPKQVECKILDVGAGPLTFLGKRCDGKVLKITAVDPLAEEYARIFKKYDIPQPPVITQKCAGEELTKIFDPLFFDLVVARNCIDHAFCPEVAVLQMIEVVKPECYVLLEHRENEAVTAKYLGLHQWNFSMNVDRDFLISSKNDTVNITKKYEDYFTVTCELIEEPDDGEWLVTRILKN